MHELDILLNTLTKANAATPLILALINSIKQGRAAGKSDTEIQADSDALAAETATITAADMTDAP